MWGHGFRWLGLELYRRAIAFNQSCAIVGLQVCGHYWATERDPNQGQNEKYIDVEGPCHILPDHYWHASWITHLPTRQNDFKLRIHSADIVITQCNDDWGGYFTIFTILLICLAALYQNRSE